LHNVAVTGGSRGIGSGIATALARSGHEVIAIARRQGPALEVAMARYTNLHFFRSISPIWQRCPTTSDGYAIAWARFMDW
jgi:NAD(P)-dependent dehydrogenase (short-subunit alcohol dehydrogenase family)